MATFKGQAVFWGVGNLTFTGFVSGDAQEGQCQSYTFTRTADEKLIRNGDGNVVSTVHYNPMREISFEIIPTDADDVGATGSGAMTHEKLHADSWMPVIGQVIKVADNSSAVTDAEESGTGTTTGQYIVRTASLARSNESEARISITAFTADTASGTNDLTTNIE